MKHSPTKITTTTSTIQFGSINQPNQPVPQLSPTAAPTVATIQSGGVAQRISNVLQFGNIPSPVAPVTRAHLLDIPRTHSAPPQFNSQTPDSMKTNLTEPTAAPPELQQRLPTTNDFETQIGQSYTSESSAGNAKTPIHTPSTSLPIPQPLESSMPLHSQPHQFPHYMPPNINHTMNFYQPHHRPPPYHKQASGANQQYSGIPPYHYNAQPARGQIAPSQPDSMPPQQAPYSTSPNTASAYPYNAQQPIGGAYQPIPFTPFPQPLPPQLRSPVSLKTSNEIKIPVSRKINIVNPNTKQVLDFSKPLPTSASVPAPSASTAASISPPKSTVIPVSAPLPRVSRAIAIVNPKALKTVNAEPVQLKPNDVTASGTSENGSAKVPAAGAKPSQEAQVDKSTEKPAKVVEDVKTEVNVDKSPVISAPEETAPLVSKGAESKEPETVLPESVSTCDTLAISEEDTTADADELEEGEIFEEKEKQREVASSEITETKKDIPVNRAPPPGINLVRSISAPSMAIGNMESRTTSTVKYDRDFLLQFMNLCRDKPSNLQEMKTDQQDGQPPRRHDSSTTAYGGAMGQFGFNRNAPKSVRFEENRSFGPKSGRSGSDSCLLPPMMGGMMGMPSRPDDRRRNQSSRGGRDDRRGGGRQGPATTGLTIPIDQIVPLQMTEGRWVSRPTVQQTADGKLSPEVLEKKVKGLLNKLTLEKFESISTQIIQLANQSETENDGFSLNTVIRLIFEKATDEPGFSGMYAQLCKAMMVKLSDKIIDENAVAKDGKPITGGILFRKCLLTRCQEDFEKGWKVEVGEGKPATSSAPGEEILTEEYYAAQKKKRRGLGLIQFIGELFKGGMLTENIMHHCVRRLLANADSPEEEETESLCKLMTTIGRQLDHKQAQPYVDTYIEPMTVISRNETLPSRIRYMVQDVIDLRKDNWVPRRRVAGPKTIAQIHQDAAKAKVEATRAEAVRRTNSSGGRGMPNLSQQIGASRRAPPKPSGNQDGWSSVPQKTGDLTVFGKITKNKAQAGTVALGPGGSLTSTFGGGGSKGWKNEKRQSEEKSPAVSRSSSQNQFRALEMMNNRRPSVDESQSSSSDQPPRLNQEDSTSRDATIEEFGTTTTKSPEEIRNTIQSMLKEFWNVRDVTIAAVIIREDIADPNYHVEILESFLLTALEKKPEDVKAVCQVFQELSGGTISPEHYRQAFSNAIECVEDVAIDAPQALRFFGEMFVASGLPVGELEAMAKDVVSRTVVSKMLEYART